MTLVSPYCLCLLVAGTAVDAPKADSARHILHEKQELGDTRASKYRTLNDPLHPWEPPAKREDWDRLRTRLREQTLVASGLWPMPPKTPLNAKLHGRIERDGYTVEKVFFESLPGHYVTGNLYRPNSPSKEKRPGVLCPHGHWAEGRFHDAGEKEAEQQMASKAEFHAPNARFPLQARMATLARMGCVVFHYDMVGYADSTVPGHREGFTDVDSVLRLQSFLGLQTWNSIRSLDFLAELPDVDKARIGVTGASGGGTQTFMLCAVDDRPAVAFPAVMVSTGMQGGCVCENAPLLRLGINNIALSAICAPRPMAMSGADDWTIDIERSGLPELKRVYGLYGVENNVDAKTYRQFKHNYNHVSRAMMYAWMQKHLHLPMATIEEKPIQPLSREEMSVFDKEHPRPANTASASDIRRYWNQVAQQQWTEHWPSNPGASQQFRHLVTTAVRAMTGEGGLVPSESKVTVIGVEVGPDYRFERWLLNRQEPALAFQPAVVPAGFYVPPTWDGKRCVIWLEETGHAAVRSNNGKIQPAIQALLVGGVGVLVPDLYLMGEHRVAGKSSAPLPVDDKYSGFTFGYNRSVLANRVHDVVTAVDGIRRRHPSCSVSLVGLDAVGPVSVLARLVIEPAISKAAVDLNNFSFTKITDANDPMMIPGGLRYGDLVGFASAHAPMQTYVRGTESLPNARLLVESAFKAAGHHDAVLFEQTANPEESRVSIAKWLLK